MWVINAIGLYNVMFCGLHTANVNYLKQPCVTRLNMIIGPNVKHDHAHRLNSDINVLPFINFSA